MKSGVYKIEHQASGKVYIGSSLDMPSRIKGHLRKLRQGNHENVLLRYAAEKYGVDAFTVLPLLVCAPKDLYFFEQRAADVYRANERAYGYNLRIVIESAKGMTFDRGIYISGDKYGRLTFMRRHRDVAHDFRWLCKCDCGSEVVTHPGAVKRGQIVSCGCYAKERQTELHTTHGKSKNDRTYTAWLNMRRRCYEPNNNRYSTYGAKGIRVCLAWKNSFESFYKDLGDCPIGHILGRKNVKNGYNKKNCFWATNAEQIRKRPNAHFVKVKGESMNVRDAEKVLGIHRSSINQRHRQTGETYQQVTDHFYNKRKK